MKRSRAGKNRKGVWRQKINKRTRMRKRRSRRGYATGVDATEKDDVMVRKEGGGREGLGREGRGEGKGDSAMVTTLLGLAQPGEHTDN